MSWKWVKQDDWRTVSEDFVRYFSVAAGDSYHPTDYRWLEMIRGLAGRSAGATQAIYGLVTC
jgi:hypothetical protein